MTTGECPACGSSRTTLVQQHSVEAAATHLIPPLRDPDRHERLCRELSRLWGQDRVDVRRCGKCGFGFANPFVAATAEIYNLVSGGQTSYPSIRFEFGEAIAFMTRQPRALRVLEIGAGRGAFIKKAYASGAIRESVTTEYDDAGLSELARLPGNQAFRGDVQSLAATTVDPFDVICMFQVLEHMDRLGEVFASLNRLTTPGAHIFISVPNAARTEAQERLTGFWDMPPNHIGRWSRDALAAVCAHADFGVVSDRIEPARPAREVWGLAKYRWEARAYDTGSLGGRVNAIRDRRVRGALKRTLGAWDFLMLSHHWREIPGQTRVFQLMRQP